MASCSFLAGSHWPHEVCAEGQRPHRVGPSLLLGGEPRGESFRLCPVGASWMPPTPFPTGHRVETFVDHGVVPTSSLRHVSVHVVLLSVPPIASIRWNVRWNNRTSGSSGQRRPQSSRSAHCVAHPRSGRHAGRGPKVRHRHMPDEQVPAAVSFKQVWWSSDTATRYRTTTRSGHRAQHPCSGRSGRSDGRSVGCVHQQRGLSASESRDRIECRIFGAAVDLSARRPGAPRDLSLRSGRRVARRFARRGP